MVYALNCLTAIFNTLNGDWLREQLDISPRMLLGKVVKDNMMVLVCPFGIPLLNPRQTPSS
ncbi:MAG: hypothetical protein ACKPKO_18875, partial [Candidatus Fonsibacter sp.]